MLGEEFRKNKFFDLNFFLNIRFFFVKSKYMIRVFRLKYLVCVLVSVVDVLCIMFEKLLLFYKYLWGVVIFLRYEDFRVYFIIRVGV